MAIDHTFPQSGDDDYAENFTQLGGSNTTTGFVYSGMGLSPNYTTPEVTIGTGLCYIRLSSVTISATSEDRLNVVYPVQVEQTTIALTDSDVNHIYVEPDIGTNDNGSYAAYTDTNNASADALKIGEVDTTGDTVDEAFNRAPAQAASKTVYRDGPDAEFSVDYDKANDSLLVYDEDNNSDLFEYNKTVAHESFSDISFPNITGTPTFGTHDHTASGMNTVPNSGLSNSSVTITSGTHMTGGGSLALGGSLTLDVDDTNLVNSDDADRIDVQSTAPSSPSTGDIWVDTS